MNRKQRKQAAGAAVVGFLALMLFTQAYLFISVQDLKETQSQHYQELKDSIQGYQTELDSVKNNYDVRLERMGDFVLQTQQEYENKTEKMLDIVEETERENDIQLRELREELNNLNKGEFTQIVDTVMKASVSVNTNSSRGSGAVVTEEGHIVTNYHVVRGYETVKVIDHEGKVSDARIIEYDGVRDLAILKSDKNFDAYLDLGDSDDVLIGERVMAIGSPEELDLTVTQGIVSATQRVFSEEEGPFIQTDVPINSGSSGGPLINTAGELIGINTFKIKGSESLGFAVPSNAVKKLLQEALGQGNSTETNSSSQGQSS